MELKNYFAQDSAGNIMPGANCYLYLPGTETLVTGLQSATGADLSNPFQSASNGLIQFAAPSGNYDLRVALGGRDYRVRVQCLDTTEQLEAAQIEVSLAAAHANTAAAHASSADANADRAEAARDAAQASGDIYATTAAGIAATASGNYFSVPSGDSLEYLILYLNNAGVADELKRYPSAEKLAPLISITPAGLAWAVVDDGGLVALAVKDDGTAVAGRIEADSITADSVAAESIGTPSGDLTDGSPDGFAFSFIDQYGRAAGGVKDDGTLAFADLEVTRINGVQFAALVEDSALPTERNYTAEVNMILSYGQSLSTGTDAVPPITTTQRFDNLRFAGGVRTQDSATPYTSLVPLIETQFSTNMGETHIGGASDMIKELVFAEDGLAYTSHNYQLLGSAPGAGGSPIANLVKGTSPYTRFMADVSNGYSLSQAAGKTFKVQAFFWTQGESDYIGSTPAATYKAALVGLRNNIDSDVKAVTSQSEPVVCISYQTQGHAVYGHANDAYIAVAQLQVAKDNPNHYIACPLYWSQQSVHQSAQNSKLLGAYYGLAYKRVVIDGIDWKPLMPVSVNKQGKLAQVRMNVPHGKLVMDTGFRAAQPGMGFTLVDAANTELTIASVAIVGPDLVKITAASTIPAGAKLRYGFGNGGNLRDQQGDVIVFDGGGQNFPMHNWCVIFEQALS